MLNSFTTLGELIHWAELMAEKFEYWEDADAIRRFGKTWRDLQNLYLEEIRISRLTESSVINAAPTLYGYNVKHLALIAEVLQKENIPPERVAEALTDIGKILQLAQDEFIETLRSGVKI